MGVDPAGEELDTEFSWHVDVAFDELRIRFGGEVHAIDMREFRESGGRLSVARNEGGTVGLLTSTSSGIEPHFKSVFLRVIHPPRELLSYDEIDWSEN